MDEQIESLLEFLHDNNSNVRKIALEHLLGYTIDTSPYKSIFKRNNFKPIEDLKKLCNDDIPNIAHDAFKALVNLSSDQEIYKRLNDDDFLLILVTTIMDSEAIFSDLACMLLSNLTKDEKIILPQGPPISKLIIFTEHPNLVRRGVHHHPKMLSKSNINILPYILLPLCGPEEFDLEKREPDTNLRKILLESLLLLTSTQEVREILREKKVYIIIRQLHLAIVKKMPSNENENNVEEEVIIEKIKIIALNYHYPPFLLVYLVTISNKH
ncbi:5079_t:CDS:10 [Entrophospora sp. SA101]|nr:5079_t:CDS:10 [Entrophospora sp. SA101]